MVSMKDIAQKLNISRCTVSNILNNKLENKSYKKETIDLVIKTAKEMGYVSNHIAKSLKTGATRTIAIVVPDIANTFYINIIKEVERLATEADYSLIICMAEERLEKENKALKMLQSRMVDGVMISPVSYTNSLTKKYPFKILCFDRTVDENRFCSVLIDNEQAAKRLTDKLIQKSANNPLFLAGSESDYTVVERLRGFRDALEKKGIALKEENVVYGIFDDNTAYEKLSMLIKEKGYTFDSIFLSTNFFVYGVLRVLRENGITLKAIGGFEDVNGADLLDTEVIRLVQPEREIARTAFKKLLGLLNNKKETNSILKADMLNKK